MVQQLAPVRATNTESLALRVFRESNDAREQHGVPRCKHSAQLDKAARGRARRQARQGFLSHSRWLLALQWVRFPTSRGAGENLAHGFTTADGTVKAWLASSAHRRNLLDGSFAYMGVGVAVSQSGHVFIAQLFGGR